MSTIKVPFRLPGLRVRAVHTADSVLTVEAFAMRQQARCPRCRRPSRHVHSYYARAPRDLPISGQAVRLRLQVRRFRCLTLHCPQRTFAERLPAVVAVGARRTTRLTATLQTLAFAAGGETGARVSTALQMPVSPDTLLRLIRRHALPDRPTPRVLGVDDFALRKGQVYGTLLVDLERQQPVDLLPDRTATTLAQWLQQHPGVAVIARDRSTEYARGATAGAPQARHVVDRWHLLRNLREALERVVSRRHAVLRDLIWADLAPNDPVATALKPPSLRLPSAAERRTSALARDHRQARYTAVRALAAQGYNILQIAKRLAMSRVTVRRYVAAEVFPERTQPPPFPSMLDPHLAYLHQRWAAGCHNASQLWRELQAAGYGGTRKQVDRWAHQQRREPAPMTPHNYRIPERSRRNSSRPALAPRQVAWFLMRRPDSMPDGDRATLAHVQQDPDVAISYRLAQQFVALVRERQPEAFDPWLVACATSQVGELQRFAAGLQQEYAAVRAALTEPWRTGPVEGHINRLKLVKRQMFGRAKFDLLRQRVLHAA